MSFIGPDLPSHLTNPKDSENDDEPSEKGPQIPAHLVQQSTLNIYDEDDDDDDDDEGPKPASGPSTGKRQLGPTLPSYAPTYDPSTYHNSEDDDDDFGPKPLPAGMQHEQADAVKEFIEREEKRRKLAEVCGKHFFTNLSLSCLCFVLHRTLPNPRASNETNGCLSLHHRQVFSEVSVDKFCTFFASYSK
jgi:hypothetical protein